MLLSPHQHNGLRFLGYSLLVAYIGILHTGFVLLSSASG